MAGRSVLAVGAHPGDIEAGCGGTLAAHRAAGDSVAMLVLAGEADAEAAAKTLDCLLVQSKLDSLATDAGTIAAIENVLSGLAADVVYVHAVEDVQAEHRAAAIATLQAARDGCRVLHYRGTGTLRFEPSVFVDVTDHLDRKLALLEEPEVEQASARYFGALARVRYAEAFAPTRFVWDL